MKKQELKDLVKNYFSLEDKKDIKEPVSTEEVKLQSAKLVDGTPITNGEDKDFEVGDHVMVTTEAGDSVIAPSGEHVLMDGITLVINGEGVITGLHKPDESGQGSLAEDLPDSGPAKILHSKESLNESGELPLSEHEGEEIATGDEPQALDERAEIIEAIMGEIAPMMEEMQKKLADHSAKMEEHEAKLKEHYSSAEETSVTEKAFSKAGLGSKPSGDILSFSNGNFKSMQYENILSRASKNNKK